MMTLKMRCGRMLRRARGKAVSQGSVTPHMGSKSDPMSVKSTAVPPKEKATG